MGRRREPSPDCIAHHHHAAADPPHPASSLSLSFLFPPPIFISAKACSSKTPQDLTVSRDTLLSIIFFFCIEMRLGIDSMGLCGGELESTKIAVGPQFGYRRA
ncbi:hypothetical protein AAC387_Pa03g1791 [Persea americana]